MISYSFIILTPTSEYLVEAPVDIALCRPKVAPVEKAYQIIAEQTTTGTELAEHALVV